MAEPADIDRVRALMETMRDWGPAHIAVSPLPDMIAVEAYLDVLEAQAQRLAALTGLPRWVFIDARHAPGMTSGGRQQLLWIALEQAKLIAGFGAIAETPSVELPGERPGFPPGSSDSPSVVPPSDPPSEG